MPDYSDYVVERLEERGGIVMGKTNSPEMGAGGNTFNDVFGYTCNPWNTNKNAGGSSGGAAVSLATGEVWLSHGSDLGGSLRTPAAYCGVVGFRASPGVVAYGPSSISFQTEGVNGPMARNVLDCALFLDAMAGLEPRAPVTWPAPASSYQKAVLEADEKVRIAYSRDWHGFTTTSDDMDRILRQALSQVEAQGGVVEEACPQLPGLDHAYRVYRSMLWASGPGRAPAAMQQHYKPTLQDNINYGRDLTIDDVYDANISRSTLYSNMQQFFTTYDVLACPVVGMHPGPLQEEYPTEIDGKPLGDYIEWLKFSYLSATTGLPSVSVPVGFTDDGLPVGMQLIGSPRGEARLLAVARAVEQAVGGPGGPIDPMSK
ncbi:MAG: amidase family protein [Gammaproteobacteria bacterium]|nr:amidase family protein [Gammaproteobacteria bacterium]